MDFRVESRHWCVDRLHACPGRHESLELITLLTCNMIMRSNIVGRENLLAIDTKFHEAEASDASSKPPTVLHLVVLEDDKVLLQRVQLDSTTLSYCLWSERINFKLILYCKLKCTLVNCPAMAQLAHFHQSM